MKIDLNKPIGKIKSVDIVFFTRHLYIMLRSGISLVESLEVLTSQAKSKHLKWILGKVKGSIENGHSFSEALQKFPGVFSQFYVSLVEIAEESGTLEENLEFLSQQLNKEYQLKKKIQNAMMYPGFIFAITLIMGTFVTVFILPQLVEFFNSFDIELPLATKILLFFAVIMNKYGIFIFIAIFAFIFGVIALQKVPAFKLRWDSIIIKVPLMGQILAYGQLARFGRNLGILIKRGVAIDKSLFTTANTLSNLRFQTDILVVLNDMKQGKGIAKSMLEHNFNEFPPLVVKMIAVGEETGNIDESLIYLSEFFEEEIDNIAKNLTTVLEPLLLVIIGCLVGFVALAIISPIYELTGNINA